MPPNSWVPGSARQPRQRLPRSPVFKRLGGQASPGQGRARGSGAVRHRDAPALGRPAPVTAATSALASPAPRKGGQRGRAGGRGRARGGRGPALCPDEAALPPAARRL